MKGTLGSKVSSLASLFERKPVQPSAKTDTKTHELPKKDSILSTLNIFKNLEKLSLSNNVKTPPKITPTKSISLDGKKQVEVKSPLLPPIVQSKKIDIIKPKDEHSARLSPKQPTDFPAQSPKPQKDSPKQKPVVLNRGVSDKNVVQKALRNFEKVDDIVMLEQSDPGVQRRKTPTFKTIKEGIGKMLNNVSRQDSNDKIVESSPDKTIPGENGDANVTETKTLEKSGSAASLVTPSISDTLLNLESKVKLANVKKPVNQWVVLVEETPPTPIVEAINGTIKNHDIPPIELLKTYQDKSDMFIGQHEHYIALTNPFHHVEIPIISNTSSRNLWKKVDFTSFERELQEKMNKTNF